MREVEKQKAPERSGAFIFLKLARCLLRDEDDVGATVFGHVGVRRVFWSIHIAFGNDFDAGGGNAERFEILLGGSGATVTQAEIVLGGATPVAVAFEEDAMSRIGVEVCFSFLDLRAFAFFDASEIEVEIDRLRSSEEIAVCNEAVGTCGEVRTGFGESVCEVSSRAANRATTRADNRRARVGPGGFFNATGESHDGAEEGE
jgi:hypothetical protein